MVIASCWQFLKTFSELRLMVELRGLEPLSEPAKTGSNPALTQILYGMW